MSKPCEKKDEDNDSNHDVQAPDGGIGKSLANIPSIIIIGRWFDKRRSLVNGLSTAGSGVGTFIFAPLLEFLLRKYGFQGTMLVMSGVMLNMCVCGSLFRSVPKSEKHKFFKKNRQKLYVFAIFTSGVASICCVFACEYWHFVLYSCILGLFAGGSYNVLPPVILVDLLGVENLASSCGIALLFQGLGFLVGPPMAGFEDDVCGHYDK
ncbi:monocarboxylate transporter 14-like [Mytilus californianus]|uniref:monocarboxylate transporter 14-like n=1 Tax=Mytilus californianus TaxID=6549 RepID=UPI0022482DDE|nr:monocarboxylate transporter 14-like [Mytilus californianus]